MMPTWPALEASSQCLDQGTVTASSSGTTVASGISNAKGSYVELVAATATDSSWMALSFRNVSGVVTSFLIDIAVGAAASEQVILSNLYYRKGNVTQVGIAASGSAVLLPISIPAGVRLSARAQNSSGSAVPVRILVHLFSA